MGADILRSMKKLAIFFLLLGRMAWVEAFAMYDFPKFEIADDGHLSYYCKARNIDILPGSLIRFRDCVECICSYHGLSCQGFGIKAGKNHPPDGCRIISVGCIPKIVRNHNTSQLCGN